MMALMFAALIVLSSGCGRGMAQQRPPVPAVTVAPAESKEIVEWDEFTGRLEAVNSVAIRPRVSGFVAAIRFDEGAMVKKGDLLFEIDARPFQAEVDRLRAELARTNATVIASLLRSLATDYGKTVIMVSHDPKTVEVFPEVHAMRDGRFVDALV